MTIFRLYAHNGHCADFWVQHRDWTNACALVKSVNGLRSGALPRHAEHRADADVLMESFDVRSGRPLEGPPPSVRDRAFTQIAEPAWYRRLARSVIRRGRRCA
jgi:hypothetical protein